MFCIIQGTVHCLLPCKKLKYTAMHQQQYLVQPANTQDLQPAKKIWKMECDGSLAPPPPAYWTSALTGQGGGLDKGRAESQIRCPYCAGLHREKGVFNGTRTTEANGQDIP